MGYIICFFLFVIALTLLILRWFTWGNNNFKDVVDIKILEIDGTAITYTATLKNGNEVTRSLSTGIPAKSNVPKNIKSVEFLTRASESYYYELYSTGHKFNSNYMLFIVTYNDLHKEIVNTLSGTKTYRTLLKMRIDGQSERKDVRRDENITANPPVETSKRTADSENHFELKENELPRGEYLIGKDIPEGIYDFFVVYGNGGSFDLMKYDENHKIIDGMWDITHNIGLKESYEKREILHVNCKDGYTLRIKGNVIVRIAKSDSVKINL